MAIFQCDLLKNSKNRCIAIATELFFVFFRREKNKHNGTIYLISFTYNFDVVIFSIFFLTKTAHSLRYSLSRA